MLSNEQRAHDLAIAYVSSQFAFMAAQDRDGNVTFDIFTTYMDVYEKSLAAFKKRFADEPQE